MLLKPAIGVQFDGGDLRWSKERPDKRGEGPAGVIAAQAGDDHPEVSTIGILRHAAPAEIDRTEFRLRRHVPRLRGPGEPANRIRLAKGNSFASSVPHAEGVLGARISLLGELQQLIESCGCDRRSPRVALGFRRL